MQKFILQYIFRKLFEQGFVHKSNLVAVYSLIRSTLEEEFTEDNEPTLRAFSDECYNTAWESQFNSHFS